MIKILVSDDNRRLFEPWSEKAVKFDMELHCYSNWEEAQFELDNNWDAYEFIILDGKGKIQEDAVAANSKHLMAAVQWLKEQLGNGKYKPAIVYTGFYEAIEEFVIKDGQILEVFDKGKTEFEEVLQFILKQIDKTPEKIVRAEFQDVFELFDSRLLSNDIKKEFIEICKEIKSNNPDEFKATLRRMRPIIENVLIRLNEADENLIPRGLFKKGGPEISGIIFHLAGKPKFNRDTKEMEYHAERIFPDHVYYSIDKLYDITSKVAMHDYKAEITKYLVKSCFLSLLEFLIWFKNFYLKNYN